MSNNLELVEKLVEKTGVSYTEAKNALDRTGGDMLEAIINLETEGRIARGKTAQFSTNAAPGSETRESDQSGEYTQQPGRQARREERRQQRNGRDRYEEKQRNKEAFNRSTKSIGRWLRDLFDMGNTNCIELHRKGEKILGLPVTVFIVLLIFCFWVIIPLMIVGLFFGCRYYFSGAELGKENVNNAMDKATDFAENIKHEFTNGKAE